MNLRFKKVISHLKNEGIIFFIKKRFRLHILAFFLMPYYLIVVKLKKFNTIDSIVNFVSKSHRSYFFSIQVKSELISMLQLVKKNEPRVLMEIGTAQGGTLFSLSRVSPKNSKIISLDLPGGRFGGGYPWWKIPLFKSFAVDNQKIKLVRDDSHSLKTVERIRGILKGQKIDFLFIDGDHTYEGVKKDFELYSPLVKPGGIICFHDIMKVDSNLKIINKVGQVLV